MSSKNIIDSMATKFDAEWNKVLYPIEWPNVPKRFNTVPYVRFSVVFFESVNAVVGGAKQRRSGLIVISIFIDANAGYGLGYSIGDDVMTVFQNQQFSNIFTYAGTTKEVGKDLLNSNLYMLNAEIPFESVN